MKKRIAISGKMTSGKTTCSNHLIKQYGYERISFAVPIKWIVEVWFRDYCENRSIYTEDDILAKEDILYAYLVKIFLGDVTKASRATDMLIKEILPEYYDIDWTVEKNARWRKCLQDVGGGRVRSEIDDNVWINYLLSTLDPNGLYICDDLRYKNEFNLMRIHGFETIRLEVSPAVQQERIKKIYGDIPAERLVHSSEIDLDQEKFPYVIDADKELIWVLHELTKIIEEE